MHTYYVVIRGLVFAGSLGDEPCAKPLTKYRLSASGQMDLPLGTLAYVDHHPVQATR